MRGAIKAIPVALATIAASLLAIGGHASPAYACSGDPGDIIGDSATVIRGRITGWREVESNIDRGSWRPIEVSVSVSSVYKGDAPATFTFVDGASYEFNGGQAFWSGAGGGCGVFDFDPMGAEIIMPVRRGDDGDIQVGRLSVLYIGPASDRLDQVDAMIRARLGEPHPPSVGTGLQSRHDTSGGRLIALGLMLITVAATAEAARRLSGARSG